MAGMRIAADNYRLLSENEACYQKKKGAGYSKAKGDKETLKGALGGPVRYGMALK